MQSPWFSCANYEDSFYAELVSSYLDMKLSELKELYTNHGSYDHADACTEMMKECVTLLKQLLERYDKSEAKIVFLHILREGRVYTDTETNAAINEFCTIHLKAFKSSERIPNDSDNYVRFFDKNIGDNQKEIITKVVSAFKKYRDHSNKIHSVSFYQLFNSLTSTADLPELEQILTNRDDLKCYNTYEFIYYLQFLASLVLAIKHVEHLLVKKGTQSDEEKKLLESINEFFKFPEYYKSEGNKPFRESLWDKCMDFIASYQSMLYNKPECFKIYVLAYLLKYGSDYYDIKNEVINSAINTFYGKRLKKLSPPLDFNQENQKKLLSSFKSYRSIEFEKTAKELISVLVKMATLAFASNDNSSKLVQFILQFTHVPSIKDAYTFDEDRLPLLACFAQLLILEKQAVTLNDSVYNEFSRITRDKNESLSPYYINLQQDRQIIKSGGKKCQNLIVSSLFVTVIAIYAIAICFSFGYIGYMISSAIIEQNSVPLEIKTQEQDAISSKEAKLASSEGTSDSTSSKQEFDEEVVNDSTEVDSSKVLTESVTE